jgi:hypothetical protein
MKNFLFALTVGYVLGAKTGKKEIEQFNRSVTALLGTDEFADVVSAARSHLSSSLRELASVLDSDHRLHDASGDVVAKVRSLVGSD